MSLNSLKVKQLDKRGWHGDGNGLYLQVGPTGSKSWLFRYAVGGTREKRNERAMGLGPYPLVSLADARQRADVQRRLLLDDVDPIDKRRKDRSDARAARLLSRTFREVALEKIEVECAKDRSPRHGQQWRSAMEALFPSIGNILVADLSKEHVIAALKPAWDKSPEAGNRLRARLEAVLTYAMQRGYRPAGVNLASWKDSLSSLFVKGEAPEHYPSLPYASIAEFIAALRQREGIAARAVELTILCATRSGETRKATWAEFDLDNALWTIPAAHMKLKKEHRVPLSAAAVALLRSMPRTHDLVFPGRNGRALSDMSLSAVLKRMNAGVLRWVDATDGRPAVVHGMRSTFRTWVQDRSNFSREVAEAALAHKIGDAVEQAYARADMLAKRAKMMQAWADFCEHIPSAKDSNVVALGQRSA